jgi:putative MATE family efflux protein
MNAVNHPTHDPRTRRLLEAPVLPTLLALAAPNALVMLTQSAVSMLEVYFLSRLGLEVLAGVSEVFPLVALVAAISTGAVGGGIVSAIARTLGQGRREAASELAWYALIIAIVLGLLTTLIILALGRTFYVAMGAKGEALDAAMTYSTIVFAGAVLIWIFNALLSVVRGTGNALLPVLVVCGGAVILIPLSPLLIFGFHGIQGLGVSGGAVALLIYYAGGSTIFAAHIWRHKGVLKPEPVPPRFSLSRAYEILRVGGLSTLVSASTNLTIAITTGFVGQHGAAAVAGYGAGSRLEFFLVPLAFGIGGPMAILVSTNIGAGNPHRALKAAWLGVGIAAVMAELIGLAAAAWPHVWISAFTHNPDAIAAGCDYLHKTGPFFGFFGAGFALYCAAQGTGRMELPLTGAFVRSVIAIGGGLAVASLGGIFLSVAVGMAAFGLIGLPGLLLRIGFHTHSRTEAKA